jgi:glycosyltransferase involved in cell wall biosynthesis
MTIPFEYHLNFFGGTENMAKHFHKNVLPNSKKFYNYQSIVLPGVLPDFKNIVENEKDIILWLHNRLDNLNYDLLFYLNDPRLLKKIKYIVVPSNWHKKYTTKELNISEKKIIVIPNFFNPINKNKNKFNKIEKVKIIYTSAADRGLEILCKSLEHIKEDFELNIFSNIYPDILEEDNLFKKIEKDKRVMFFGQTPQKVVHEYLYNSHIFAYPSTCPEIFCISLAEAIGAECLPVYPNIGALKETANSVGICYEYEENKELHVKLFAKILSDVIIQIKNNGFDPKNQAQIIEERYNYKKFEKDWEKLHEEL